LLLAANNMKPLTPPPIATKSGAEAAATTVDAAVAGGVDAAVAGGVDAAVSVPVAVPPPIPGTLPTATTSVSGHLTNSPPAAVTDPVTAPQVPVHLTAPLLDNLPVADAVHLPTALSTSAAVSASTLFTQFPLPLTAETTPAPVAAAAPAISTAPAPPVASPGRPFMMNAATNTQLPSTQTRAEVKPSFNEALLSAK